MPERLRGWCRTGLSMALLLAAQLIVALVPLRFWRQSLGAGAGDVVRRRAALLAAHIERAAERLPWTPKCLVQAVALGWLLRREGIAHVVVLAVRPPECRSGSDILHAWIEAGGACILGDLPGPWHEIRRFSGEN